MTEFTTSTTTGIVLDSATVSNPVTIDAGVTISNTAASFSGDAVYGKAGTAWNVTNDGTISPTRRPAMASTSNPAAR